MKKMSMSDADRSNGEEFQRLEIIIGGKDVEPTQRHPKCCIYKVPNKLRHVKEEAYTPKLISIGPVHHYEKGQDNNKGQDNKKEQDHKEELENMESLKLRYVKEFFDHTTCKGLKEFAHIIKKRETDIRHCYAEEISWPKGEVFVKMILVDSIFIIELFLRTDSREENKADYILSKPWLEEGIKHDLILLENQLPFFILEELHHHIECSPVIRKSFIELACNYFLPNDNCKNIPEVKDIKHFTDLQRYFYYSPKLKSSDSTIEHLHSATKLDTAGLNFKKWKLKSSEDRRLLDIQIKKPNFSEICPRFICSWLLHCLHFLKFFQCLKCMQTSLVIPQFVINHGTEHIFRNIMALEQCHYPKEAYICNYIALLDFLINTRDDAELLVDKKIIVHSLGSNKEVAKMVNKLGKEIVEKNSCYHDLAVKLNKHYKNWWNKNIASLKAVYFRDIWRGTATFVGIIVLLVTIGNFLRPIVYHK